MYRAFNAIALNRIKNIPGLDREKGTLTVYRGTNIDERNCARGIADSTSLLGFLDFVNQSEYFFEIKVPICDVQAAYFLSNDLYNCDEKEVVCDLSYAAITQVDNPEFISGGGYIELVG